MREGLTVDVFAGRVGERFRLTDGDDTHELTLVECEALGETTRDRIPFSLVFVGPRTPLLPQRIYTVGRDDLGDLEIFLVPIEQNDEGTSYQAVFT